MFIMASVVKKETKLKLLAGWVDKQIHVNEIALGQSDISRDESLYCAGNICAYKEVLKEIIKIVGYKI